MAVSILLLPKVSETLYPVLCYYMALILRQEGNSRLHSPVTICEEGECGSLAVYRMWQKNQGGDEEHLQTTWERGLTQWEPPCTIGNIML